MKKTFLNLIASVLCLVLCFGFFACGNNNQGNAGKYEDNDEDYEITWFLPITTDGIALSQPDMDEIQDEINEIIYPKIKARLNIVQILWYTYNDQIVPRVSSGEKFDLCFTSPTVNYYWTNIRRQAFLPLNQLVEDYAPHIKASVPAYMLDQATYTDGKYYGIVNQQIIPRTDAALIRDYELFDRFLELNYEGYDHNNIYEYIVDQDLPAYDILEEYVRWLKLNNKGLGGLMGAYDVMESLQTRYHYEDLGTGIAVPGVIDCDDDPSDGLRVFNQFETEEFKNDIQRMAGYYKEGLAPEKIKIGDKGTSMDAYDVASLITWKPNDVRINTDGKQGGAVRLGNPYYYISYVLGSMTAISSTSANPARVMKFLDLLWSDADLMNLLCFGIEGEHYDYTDKGNSLQIKQKANSGYDNSVMTWAYASEFTEGLCYIDRYTENPYKQSQKINEDAKINAALGFNFDDTKVSVYIAQCRAEAATYLSEFSTGVHGDKVMEKYEEFMKKLNEAGMNKIIEEKQRQLDEWLKNKK